MTENPITVKAGLFRALPHEVAELSEYDPAAVGYGPGKRLPANIVEFIDTELESWHAHVVEHTPGEHGDGGPYLLLGFDAARYEEDPFALTEALFYATLYLARQRVVAAQLDGHATTIKYVREAELKSTKGAPDGPQTDRDCERLARVDPAYLAACARAWRAAAERDVVEGIVSALQLRAAAMVRGLTDVEAERTEGDRLREMLSSRKMAQA